MQLVLGWYNANGKSTRLTAKQLDLAPKRVTEQLGIEKQLRKAKGEGRRNRKIYAHCRTNVGNKDSQLEALRLLGLAA